MGKYLLYTSSLAAQGFVYSVCSHVPWHVPVNIQIDKCTMKSKTTAYKYEIGVYVLYFRDNVIQWHCSSYYLKSKLPNFWCYFIGSTGLIDYICRIVKITITLTYFQLPLCVCVCVFVCCREEIIYSMSVRGSQRTTCVKWFSFHCLHPGHRTQVGSLYYNCLYLLRHLTGPGN